MSVTELHQLLKLPVLVSHFMEHRSANSDLGFGEFIAMHYATNHDHDSRDKELPFKSFCDSACASAVYLPAAYSLTIQQPVLFDEIIFGEYLPPNNGSNFQRIVWQPPRMS